jgi:hypothetical protein
MTDGLRLRAAGGRGSVQGANSATYLRPQSGKDYVKSTLAMSRKTANGRRANGLRIPGKIGVPEVLNKRAVG